MKRARSNEEIVTEVIRKLGSFERVPKDVIIQLLSKSGLSVFDINRFCNSSTQLRQLCQDRKLWEKIYVKYVRGANLDKWHAQAEGMPNQFLRFLSFYVVNGGTDDEDDYYTQKMESPSKSEALILIGRGRILPYHKMPEGYQKLWEQNWKSENIVEPSQSDDDESDGDGGNDIDEEADQAFNEQFSDSNGIEWHYIRTNPNEPDEIDHKVYRYGKEILTLVEHNIMVEDEIEFRPVNSMEYVFYSLISLGWKLVNPPYIPDIRCNVCNQAASTMCSECKTPICSQVCFETRHPCSI